MRPIVQFAKKSRFAVPAVAAAALVVVMFAPTASATTQTVTTPFSAILINPCNGNDLVVVSGTFHTVTDITTDRVRVMNVSSDLDGQGFSATYHGSLRDDTVTDIGPLPAHEVREEHIVLNSQTSIDNFEMFVNVHIVVDDSGPHTVVDIERTECRG